MKIHLAKLGDIPKIKYIFKAFRDKGGWAFSTYTYSYYLQYHILKKTCFVLKEENKIIGALCLENNDEFCEIEALAIQKRMRRKGYGKKLLCYAIKWCKRHNVKKVKIWSYKDFGVRDFYLNNGKLKELEFDNNENCYVFEKDLK